MKFQRAIKLYVRSVNAPTIILSVEKTESDNQEHSSVRSIFTTLQSGDADVFLCSDRERCVLHSIKYKMDHTRVSHWANVFFFLALLHRPRSAAGHAVEQ